MVPETDSSSITADQAMLNQLPPQSVNRLFSLARDRSEYGRTLLVTELVTLLDRHSLEIESRDTLLISDIVDELVNNAPLAVRQTLAKKLAPLATTPRRLALSLAGDQIEVAQPILTHSPVLTDADLITLVVTQGVDHARAVAGRSAISEALADALVITGDVAVMQALAENLGARLSLSAMTAMVNAARFAETLCRPVLERPEMTAEKAATLYWWVAPALRREAMQRFGVAAGQTEKAMEQTIEDLLQRYALMKNEYEVMEHVADWLTERGMTTTLCLIQILRLRHFRLFSILLSRLINLPEPLTEIVITELGGASLAAAARLLKLEKAQFLSIFLLSRGARHGDQMVNPQELNNALAAFDRVSPIAAKEIFATWRVNPQDLIDRARGGTVGHA